MQLSTINSFTQGISFRRSDIKPGEISDKINKNNITVSNPIPQGFYMPRISFGSKNNPTFDSFTGLRDKKCLLHDLDKMLEKAAEKKENISIAMFDMDNFKSVNELLGYKTGDMFIKTMSKNISDVANEKDIHAYRFGGDEFVLLLGNQDEKEQKETVEKILQITNNNDIFKAQEKEYRANAAVRLSKFGNMNEKVHKLTDLMAQKSILVKLNENLTTQAAKNDPYLIELTTDVNSKIHNLCTEMVDQSLEKETNPDSLAWLTDVKTRMDSGVEIKDDEYRRISDYSRIKFYKSLEIAQTKKWISDFNKTGGFSVTGGIISFSPEAYEDKSALDLINETGEELKKGKNTLKGKAYFITKTEA